MDLDEMVGWMKENPELAASLEEAIGRNEDAKELSGILDGAGVDTKTAEALVAEYQRRRGASISVQNLDDEALAQVAGGGTGIDCSQADDCDTHYTEEWYWGRDRCNLGRYCDEYWACNSNDAVIDPPH